MKLQVKFCRVVSEAYIPQYAHPFDSGFDFRTYYSFIVPPQKGHLVKTGLKVELPQVEELDRFGIGVELQTRAKSGLATEYGICLSNGVGTVDFGYTGELMIPLFNLSGHIVKFSEGDKVAQGVLMPVFNRVDFTIVDEKEIHKTERSDGGFGSTGS